MEFLMILTGMLIAAAVTALVVFSWAASQLRWLAAHCHQHLTYWRKEAERARVAVARYDRPGGNDFSDRRGQ